MKQQNKRKGFTLVELLVVIAILAILATVSVVGYTAFITRARQSNCDTEAYQVQEAINAALMVPNGEYVIGTNSSNTYVIKAAKVTSGGTESGNEFIAIWKVSSDGKTVELATADADSKTGASDTNNLQEVFKTNSDFKELCEKGIFTIVKNSETDGLVIQFQYKNYSEVKANITIDTTIVK